MIGSRCWTKFFARFCSSALPIAAASSLFFNIDVSTFISSTKALASSFRALASSPQGVVTEHRVQRRLAAILAADVVGYSALMERDEEATYAEFERLRRELIEPGLSRHEGRLIKTTGDGALAEFASPLAAMRCAVEIQDHLAASSRPLRLRVGLNLGDIIVGQDGDLYGDGINIAVRLEGIADPGGILISKKVYSEVEGKLDVGFEDRGEQARHCRWRRA